MKILYIGVHYLGNEKKWRTETWIDSSFTKHHIETSKIDYKQIIKASNYNNLKKIIHEKSDDVDLIFLQRGKKLKPGLFTGIGIPIIFWSTEPINLKNDVDRLLSSNIFSWVFVHTYSCLNRIQNDFPHLLNKSSVMHNAISENKISSKTPNKKHFAIFNRNLSIRRRWWLWPCREYVKIVKGNFGDSYYRDLCDSVIAVNIHFTSKNLDDFETGIFEAMASGCVVLSEKLCPKTIEDLDMIDSIIQVNSRKELKSKLKYLKQNPDLIVDYQHKTMVAIKNNTWYHRVELFKKKFEEILSIK